MQLQYAALDAVCLLQLLAHMVSVAQPPRHSFTCPESGAAAGTEQTRQSQQGSAQSAQGPPQIAPEAVVGSAAHQKGPEGQQAATGTTKAPLYSPVQNDGQWWEVLSAGQASAVSKFLMISSSIQLRA